MTDQQTIQRITTRLVGLPPDPDGQNDERAEWAEQAILQFELVTRSDRETSLRDLLTDLMHWGDRNGVNFDAELHRATTHYSAETSS